MMDIYFLINQYCIVNEADEQSHKLSTLINKYLSRIANNKVGLYRFRRKLDLKRIKLNKYSYSLI